MVQKKNTKKKEDIKLPYRLKLKKPVTLTSTKTIEEIVFKYEPTLESIEHFSLDGTGQTMGNLFPVISAMIDEPSDLIRRLSIPDGMRCAEIASFFVADLETTESVAE